MNSSSCSTLAAEHHWAVDAAHVVTDSQIAPVVKTALVDVLAAIPWYPAQRVLAALVRLAWPGFRGA